MKAPSFTSIPEYIATLPAAKARVIKRIVSLVSKSVPGSTQVISYNIPAFKLQRVFMYCAAFKSHIGIYPPLRDDKQLRTALEPYANAKGNLSFPLDEPIPYDLITRLAKALARQYAAASASQSAGKKKKTRSV